MTRVLSPTSDARVALGTEMSALEGLPSFSKAAFSQTSPQFVYKEVRRIGGPKGSKQPGEYPTEGECRPTLVKQRPLPEVKSVLLINGVDPKCKNVIKFKSTDYALPFLYGDSNSSTISSPKPQPRPQQAPTPTIEPESAPLREESHERKRPKRDSERRVSVEVAIQPERKRPKRESERRAEAAARQGK